VASVELRGLTKRYGNSAVVDDVSLTIEHGHLVCLLGPSGCGKTTTLRLIAGFIEPSEGEIRVGERLVSSPANTLPPERRNMSMIFQSYALWPHMTVAENIVYGLKLRKMDRDTIGKKLDAILGTTKLAPLAQRYPGELSGGQQQRVALARAIVIEPALLLLDEPLGALDKSLRQSMQVELRGLQRRLRITTVMVTHDQDEALTMADRIVIMRDGQIEQVGPPEEVYQHPLSRFTASFLGASNFFRGRVTRTESGTLEVTIPDGPTLSMRTSREVGGEVSVALRPEAIAVDLCEDATTHQAVNATPALVEQVVYHGFVTHLHLRLPNGEPFLAYLQHGTDLAERAIAPGRRVFAHWSADALQIVREEPV
jgi:ABC-type Fe3+/spermidine/putrescine transport system ATPase subunit